MAHTLGLFDTAKKLTDVKIDEDQDPWVRKGMVVKIRNWPENEHTEGSKANVTGVSERHIHLEVNGESLQMRLFDQFKRLGNVIPGNSGSKVMVLSSQKLARIESVSKQDLTVTVKHDNGELQTVKVSDVCRMYK